MKIVVVFNYFLDKLGDVSYIELYKLVGTHRPQIDQVASTADDDGEDKRGGDQPEVEVQLRVSDDGDPAGRQPGRQSGSCSGTGAQRSQWSSSLSAEPGSGGSWSSELGHN